MKKEEIALEILKTISNKIIQDNNSAHSNISKAITDAYNYIYENLKIEDKSDKKD